ncbi:hypothetical protein HGP14_34140 [Rhizobium sp. P32RR-XVIII]|uniref:hypothetical protein n=1 Tax=Rhizobium sp. P32RR-XVIII TaxID=2726738 RepID=UPI00145687AE|nr:hypothetical protein [Rhizobium sp. P32RR-XVIII]NLS08234.1 hypothetical protein [Rhizobium sp. P32RR-XVIII]
MADRNPTTSRFTFWNASVLALGIVLAAMLYVFGIAMSGDTTELTASVHGADVMDTRDVPN